MKIVLYEVKKILSTKVSIFLIIFLFSYCLIYPITYVIQYRSTNQKELRLNIREIEETYLSYSNIPISEESYKSLLQKQSNKLLVSSYGMSLADRMNEILEARNYRKMGICHSNQVDYLIERPDEIISENKINQKISDLKRNMSTDTFIYKNLVKQSKMMKQSGEPQFGYQYFWSAFDRYETYAVLIFSVFIIVIISTVFSQEYHSNMYMMLLSSIMGKIRIVNYKLISSSIIGMLGIIVINLFMGGIFLIFGSSRGYNLNLNSLNIDYCYSPYNITVLQYCIIKIIYQVIAILILISIMEFLSFKLSRGAVVILAGIVLSFLGYIINIISQGAESILSYFSITYGLMTKKIFYKYSSFSIFGKPITYAIAYIIFGCLIILLLNILTYLSYSKGKYKFFQS